MNLSNTSVDLQMHTHIYIFTSKFIYMYLMQLRALFTSLSYTEWKGAI